ncbi:MAG TPA: peptidoglycan recognition family protein, partial [Thermosynechococcaceae cyanobacterium]
MRRTSWTAIAIVILVLAAVVLTSNPGLAQLTSPAGFELPGRVAAQPSAQVVGMEEPSSTTCALQPEPKISRTAAKATLRAVTLARFRQLSTSKESTTPDYQPREEVALADPSNYGDRYLRDVNGQPVNFAPIVVLHETVGSADSAINLFSAYHANDDDQASYHTLIRQNGTLVYVVPPDKRAFGAGDSVFVGLNGTEAVKTKADFPPSVNNFAYHISLESPADGFNNGYQHSGYTPAQYQSLAWLVAKTGVRNDRITTH